MKQDSGPILMLIAGLFFAFMDILVKLVPHIPTFEAIFFRFLFGALLALLSMRILKIKIRLVEHKLLALRIIFGFLSIYTLFVAISLTYLSNAIVLFFTAPVFSIILAHVFLKEKTTKAIVLPLLLSLVGIFLIIKPNLAVINPGDIYAVLSGLFCAMGFTALKKLESIESAWTITIASIFGMLLLSTPLAAYSFAPVSSHDLLILLLMGVFGFLGVVFMTFAFKYCGESEGTELLMFEAVVTAVIGVLIFREIVDPYSIIGSILVLSSNFYITMSHAHIEIHLHHR